MKLSTIGSILIGLSMMPLWNSFSEGWSLEKIVAFASSLAVGIILLVIDYIKSKKH